MIIHEGEVLRSTLKHYAQVGMGEIAVILKMSRQNFNHHLRKNILDDDFRQLVKNKLFVFRIENEFYISESSPISSGKILENILKIINKEEYEKKRITKILGPSGRPKYMGNASLVMDFMIFSQSLRDFFFTKCQCLQLYLELDNTKAVYDIAGNDEFYKKEKFNSEVQNAYRLSNHIASRFSTAVDPFDISYLAATRVFFDSFSNYYLEDDLKLIYDIIEKQSSQLTLDLRLSKFKDVFEKIFPKQDRHEEDPEAMAGDRENNSTLAKENKLSFGSYLKLVREEKGISYDKIKEDTGVSEEDFKRYENDSVQLDLFEQIDLITMLTRWLQDNDPDGNLKFKLTFNEYVAIGKEVKSNYLTLPKLNVDTISDYLAYSDSKVSLNKYPEMYIPKIRGIKARVIFKIPSDILSGLYKDAIYKDDLVVCERSLNYPIRTLTKKLKEGRALPCVLIATDNEVIYGAISTISDVEIEMLLSTKGDSFKIAIGSIKGWFLISHIIYRALKEDISA